jgi:hypothetical protein
MCMTCGYERKTKGGRDQLSSWLQVQSKVLKRKIYDQHMATHIPNCLEPLYYTLKFCIFNECMIFIPDIFY